MAGVTGRCPLCKSLVQVPKPVPQPAAFSEDAILDFLGPSPDLADKSASDTIHDFGDSVIMHGSAIHHTPRKTCTSAIGTSRRLSTSARIATLTCRN